MGANKTVVTFFKDRMTNAGYSAKLGYVTPDFAKNPGSGINVELWLSNGESQMWENTYTPIETSALIECYVYRVRKPEDSDGQFYEDVETALNALADNSPDRDYVGKIWWDNRIIAVDFVSPLKRWNNSSEYAGNLLVARIDLEINFLTTIT